MPQTRKKPARNKSRANTAPGDVLTLAEAAAYLRVKEEEVLRMIVSEGLPGRQFGTEWRFLKMAVQDWLATPPQKKGGLLRHLGELKDDPYVPEMLEEIYKQRGRTLTAEG